MKKPIASMRLRILRCVVRADPKEGIEIHELCELVHGTPEDIRAVAYDLFQAGYIYISWGQDFHCFINDKGRVYLQSLEDEFDKETNDKEQQSLQNKISIASVLVSLVSFIFGLVVEYGFSPIESIVRLFGF